MRNFFRREAPFNPTGQLSDSESKKLGPKFREAANQFAELPQEDRMELLYKIRTLRDALKNPSAVMEVARKLISAQFRSHKAKEMMDKLFEAEAKPVSEIDPRQFAGELEAFNMAVGQEHTTEQEQEDMREELLDRPNTDKIERAKSEAYKPNLREERYWQTQRGKQRDAERDTREARL